MFLNDIQQFIAYFASMIGFVTWAPYNNFDTYEKGGQVTKPIIHMYLWKYAMNYCMSSKYVV